MNAFSNTVGTEFLTCIPNKITKTDEAGSQDEASLPAVIILFRLVLGKARLK